MRGEIARQKKELRDLLRVRRQMAARDDVRAAFSLRDVFVSCLRLWEGTTVAVYVAQGSEMDPAPIAAFLDSRGYGLALPWMEKENRDLTFRAYALGDRLEAGPWGIPQPFSSCPAKRAEILLVPLLGFDRHGNRLGLGGGYYDRALAALREQGRVVAAYGLAYAAQEVPFLPVEPHDQKLDGVFTEKGFIDPAV